MNKIIKILLIFVLVSFGSYNVFATPTELYGISPSYANTKTIIYASNDYITNISHEIANFTFKTDGSFSVKFDLKETTSIFMFLGSYKGIMFLEPGKSYKLILPDRVDKNKAENLNPFFDYTEFNIGISNAEKNELNFMIRTFNNTYNPYFTKFAQNIYSRNSQYEVEKTINEIELPFKESTNEFFNNYRIYKYGMLKQIAFQYKLRTVATNYFINKTIQYQNPAYMELFNQSYNNYFTYFGRTEEGKDIFEIINKQKSFTKLKKYIQQDTILNQNNFVELVLLKNLFDNFYSDKFSRSSLLLILDSLANTTKIEEHKQIAATIKNKVTKLMVGYAPPEFALQDKSGKIINLSDYKGKYVYLGFCACSSYSCIKEFEMLNTLKNKYKDALEIISISADDSLKNMTDFLNFHKYNWTFLHFGNQPQIIEEYDIRAFPVYFFIGPDGKLIYSPAAAPSENFEMYLMKYVKVGNEK